MHKSLDWRLYAPWVKRLNPWLMLVPIYSSVFVIAAYLLGQDWLLEKSLHEFLAIGLMIVPVAVLLYRCKAGHGPLYALLAFLAASLLFREIHIRHTGKAVYVCLLIFAVWTALWWGRIAPQLAEGRIFSLVVATLFTYFCSQVIARRVFRGIPGEHELHVELEEVAETAGHLLFIATSLWGLRGGRAKTEDGEGE